MGENKCLQHVDGGIFSVMVACCSGKNIRSTKNYFIKPLLLKAGQINLNDKLRRGKMTVTRMKIRRWNETLLKRR